MALSFVKSSILKGFGESFLIHNGYVYYSSTYRSVDVMVCASWVGRHPVGVGTAQAQVIVPPVLVGEMWELVWLRRANIVGGVGGWVGGCCLGDMGVSE